jgi:hypothetical protein
MWGKIPEKNNWKQSFKRRVGNTNFNKNQKDEGHKKNDEAASGNAYDYQTLEDGPAQDPEKNVRTNTTEESKSAGGVFNRFFKSSN